LTISICQCFKASISDQKLKEYGVLSYEYRYEIAPHDVRKLAKLLNVDYQHNIGILEESKKGFFGNKAYSMFGEFMDKHQIKYNSSS